jgi:cytochrome c5
MTQKAPYISHASVSTAPDLALGKELFIERCRTCHVIDTILQPRPTDDWERVVDEMTQLAWPRIRPDEAKQILHYLATTRIPKAGSVGTGFTVLDLYCLPCHKPDEIFANFRTLKEWEKVVGMMAEIAPDQVPDSEHELILKTLMEAQSKRAKAK